MIFNYLFYGYYGNSSIKVEPKFPTSKPSDNKRPLKVGGLSNFASQLSTKKQKVKLQLKQFLFSINVLLKLNNRLAL